MASWTTSSSQKCNKENTSINTMVTMVTRYCLHTYREYVTTNTGIPPSTNIHARMHAHTPHRKQQFQVTMSSVAGAC